MLKHYFKLSFRNILKNKLYSVINIAGLTIGLAVTILILAWVQHQLSYDRFHEQKNRICQVYRRSVTESPDEGSEITPGPAACDLKAEFPEIAEAARGGFIGRSLLRYQDRMFVEDQVRGVDPAFLTIFSFPLIKGDLQTALEQPHSIILTETMAEKYFGPENPLGKTIRINNKLDFQVTAIARDCPSNSHIQFQSLVPFNTIPELVDDVTADIDRYSNSAYHTFVLLHENVSRQAANEKMATFSRAREDEVYFLVPFSDIYLYRFDVINLVIVLSAVAFLILLSSCINYINITTARSVTRFKEVGIQQVAGATRWQLFAKFISESMLFVAIATLLALFVVEMILPFFQLLSRQQLTLDFTSLPFALTMVLIFLATLIFAGIYPALALSAPQPVTILKGTIKRSKAGVRLRKILITLQFLFSIVFIICTAVLYRQGIFLGKLGLGFSRADILYIRMQGELREKPEIFKDKLRQHPNILSVTASNMIPQAMDNNTDGWGLPGQPDKVNAKYTWVDFDYAQTFDMKMAAGRFFSRQFPADETQAIIINETALERLDLKRPIGTTLQFWGQPATLIGVVKDFQNVPLGRKIQPMILRLTPQNSNIVFLKVRPGTIQATLSDIQTMCRTLNPNYPQEVQFLEDFHHETERIGATFNNILLYFTILAILIASLGLFGLATFMTEQRTQEIGVRKVLGASVPSILRLLGKEYAGLLIISNLLAWPLAWFLSNGLLQNFAERISVGIGFFVFAGGVTLLIAIISVGWQAIRAATVNPVESLRYE